MYREAVAVGGSLKGGTTMGALALAQRIRCETEIFVEVVEADGKLCARFERPYFVPREHFNMSEADLRTRLRNFVNRGFATNQTRAALAALVTTKRRSK